MAKKVEISEHRLKQLLAAEQFCLAARTGFSTTGNVGQLEYRWFDRWFRLAGAYKYDVPKPVKPVWCGSCLKRHIAGIHEHC